MDKLILEDVRCFHGRHELPLAPLTILVGENSTGKSTLLAAIRLAWDIGIGRVDPDFSEEPFDWGAYDQVANFRGGRGGRAKSFVIGFEKTRKGSGQPNGRRLESDTVQVEATFVRKGAQPRISEWKTQSKRHSAVATYSDDRNKFSLALVAGENRGTYEIDLGGAPIGSIPPFFLFGEESKKFSKEDQQMFARLFYESREGARPYAIAPIRTKPQRTYEPRREVHRPEGEHVPMILASMKSSDSAEWELVRAQLREFGKASGLFRDVDIKRLGDKESDPFQVQIAVPGLERNLVDVGYGISQVLPIIVDCLTCTPKQILLVQQPEVHLHPRAQAQLGAFLGYMAGKHDNRLVVETHSDYLIDRICIDIRDNKILSPEDVCILYCARDGGGINVHPIHIDANGNIIDAPRGYRQFFLEEETRLIGG
ncbi:MAG: AAA family ATPase [Acidobacteria bacterium]|nr:AAA family ATPase [Acidobacteriota bacterium]